MKTNTIKTYTGEAFRENYVRPGTQVDTMLKAGFGRFFVVRVEDMIRLMKLPVPPTRSTNHTLIFLTDGQATMRIGSEHYRIEKGECLFVPAGQVFSFSQVDLNQGYLCNFQNDFIIGKFGKTALLKDYGFLRVWGKPRVSLDEQTAGFITQVFNRIMLHYSAHGLTNPDLIQSHFIALLCEINQVYQPWSATPPSHAVQITNQFQELLFSHCKTHHLVTDYAAMLHITSNHLHKSVRAITGKSPIKWIDGAVVLEAKVLLYQTPLSVSEVAAQVGILDSSYFSRLFKKHEGVTPLAFRKLIEKG